ncbi:MAG: glycosyltransferase family 4 protein [bacterium]
MPKIAFIDLTFNWPPIGGCWIDTLNIMRGLQRAGLDTRLFVPQFQSYYPRGRIETDLPVPITLIPFNRLTYNFATVRRRFGDLIREFNPDLLFLADGYAMKGHLLDLIAPERTILRFYAYEILCTNLHYYRYHENRVCDRGFLTDPDECRRCWFRRVPAWIRALQILMRWPERHPVLHFSQEVIASAAFTRSYWNCLKEKLNRLGCAVVYNGFIASMLKDYVRDVRIIPSGVDTDLFRPAESLSMADGGLEYPIKVFLPGRANDPLKGLDVLREAVGFLRAKGLSVEAHYTAAMQSQRPEPWMINHGWVSHEHLPALYREMDIVVVPSTWIEPFGITALEGMAVGLPVVASRTGGLAESVVHGETGFHFRPGCADELAVRLEDLVRSPDLRAKMGWNGRVRVQNEYTWDRIIDRHYLPMIWELLGRQVVEKPQPIRTLAGTL